MAVHQHGEQAAIYQVRPATVLRFRQVSGNDVNVVLVPITLYMQPVRVAATTAITDAMGREKILQSGLGHGTPCSCSVNRTDSVLLRAAKGQPLPLAEL